MLRWTITRSGLLAIGKNGFREAGREAITAAVVHWWKTYLPLHFQPIAYLRYRYNRRAPATERKKRLRLPFLEGVGDQTPAIGVVAPLVFSGRSRDLALGPPNIVAKAPAYDRYEGRWKNPARAFNFKAGDRIDPAKEITATTPQELKTLNEVFTRAFNRDLKLQGLKSPKRVYRTKAA